MSVTQKEIVERLRCAAAATNPYSYLFNLAEEIEAHGIAPPDGYVSRELVQALVDGLNKTNWSSWQTTAHFQKELDAVEAMLTTAKESL